VVGPSHYANSPDPIVPPYTAALRNHVHQTRFHPCTRSLVWSRSLRRTSILLRAQGYIVHGISPPSVGASPHLQSFDPDVEAIRTVVSSVLASGKDIVMFCHSYGGVVGSEALAQYVKDLESGTKKKG
jgi:pimeloyl-ACP methyl ester carboxylesterase